MPSNFDDGLMSSRANVGDARTFIDELLAEQRSLTAVDLFSRRNGSSSGEAREKLYRDLIPLDSPRAGEQYAFAVDLDKCSGCKACVSACHSLNGLEEGETWRSVGLLTGSRQREEAEVAADVRKRTATVSPQPNPPRYLGGYELYESVVQHVTTACHHCADPGCLNGCPVLAYEKDPVTGIVRHLDDQCMGCTYCVMKCPYEVPQYSKRLGIVRKCDMCSSRLAVGEAPACVQACPDQAIRISVIDQNEAVTNADESWKSLVAAGSPDPGITFPTTRYLSRRDFSAGVQAADHDALRLDHAHWPLVIMLVCTQAATGMFLAAALTRNNLPDAEIRPLTQSAFGLLIVGLTASVLHLGRPLRAWRSFLGWRKSWLSREIMVFGAFAALAALDVLSGRIPFASTDYVVRANLTAMAALTGLAGVLASAMVYVDTRRPFWSPRHAFGNFLGTTVLMGAAVAAAVFERTSVAGQFTRMCALIAVVAVAVRFTWRQLELRAALRNPTRAIHFNARVIRELLPWMARLQPVLLLITLVSALPVITGTSQHTDRWCAVMAMTALGSEIAWRYAFFAAGGSRRMPGGVAA